MPGALLGSVTMQFTEHFEQSIGDLNRSILLHMVGSKPGFVATELMLCGTRQVTMARIGQSDHHGRVEGAARFQVQAEFHQGLNGNPEA
jgi:hypothetical protein